MKVGKADRKEWEEVMKFMQGLEQKCPDWEVDDKDLGVWVREQFENIEGGMFRVVFGYQVLVDNACDPDSDVLEFKPEIAAAMAKATNRGVTNTDG